MIKTLEKPSCYPYQLNGFLSFKVLYNQFVVSLYKWALTHNWSSTSFIWQHNTTVSIKLLLEFKYGDFHWPNIPSSTIAREVRICLKSWRVQGSALTWTGLWLLLSGLKDIQVTWQLGTLIQDCLHKLLNNDVLSFFSLVEQEDIHVHVLYHVFYFLLCYHWWHAALTCINY